MGKKRGQKFNPRFWVLGLTVVVMALVLVQFQNCALTSSMTGPGLSIGSSASSTGGIANCQASGCGMIESIYWNHCQMTAVGWAWSNVTAQNKTVSLTNSAGDNCTTATEASPAVSDLATLYSAYPYMNGQPISYTCAFGTRGNYSSPTQAVTASVTSATGPATAGSSDVYPPADCNVTQSPQSVNTCSTGGTGTAFGFIAASQWGSATPTASSSSIPTIASVTLPSTQLSVTPNNSPGNCDLIIKGWAWVVGAPDTKVTIYLSDGSYVNNIALVAAQDNTVASPQSASNANFSCVGNNAYFYATFLNKTISKNYTFNGYGNDTLITVSGVVSSAAFGINKQLDPMYVSIPTGCTY